MDILNICENTRIRAYAHYVFACAVIEGYMEKCKSGRVLCIEVKDGDKERWVNKSANIVQNGSIFMIDKPNCDTDIYDFVYRECELEDELIVRIDEIKNTRVNAVLNLAVGWGDFEKAIVENTFCYKVGMLNNRVLTRLNEAFVTNDAIVQKRDKYIRLCRNDDMVSAYISKDGISWNFIEKHVFPGPGCKCWIGFIAENLGDLDFSKQYDDWTYMNFIQTVYDPNNNGAVWLDYWNFPRKKCRFDNVYFGAFLDIYYDEPAEIKTLAGSLFNYVQWCIAHDYYLAISLDEYFILGRTNYQKKHFFHHNMIYGIDYEKKEMYVVGYDKKVVKGTISFREFEDATHNSQGVMMRYKFNPCGEQIRFDLNVLINNIRAFCNYKGKDIRYAQLCGDNGVYGIRAFRDLPTTDRGKNYLLRDLRISFFVYEYCLLNKERIGYLYSNHYLTREEMERLDDVCSSMVNNATQLKNLTIKNEIKPIYGNRILKLYDEICHEIESFYRKMLFFLEEKNKKDN